MQPLSNAYALVTYWLASKGLAYLLELYGCVSLTQRADSSGRLHRSWQRAQRRQQDPAAHILSAVLYQFEAHPASG